ERRRRRKPAPRRNAERATRCGRSVLAGDSRTRARPHDVYRDAPLEREPIDVVRLGYGVVLALGRDRDALGRHTGIDEDLPHVLRTRRRQRFVVRSIAARIRVPFEHHDDAVHRADQLRDPRETRGGAGIELGLRGAEVDLDLERLLEHPRVPRALRFELRDESAELLLVPGEKRLERIGFGPELRVSLFGFDALRALPLEAIADPSAEGSA